MIKEEVLNSIQLKKRFCKDCGLPIVVFDNPYFMERLQTLDPLFSCVEKFNRFCNEPAWDSRRASLFRTVQRNQRQDDSGN